ncbi:hypothetical protein BDF20DRAFT_883190 [Mycotypha africana]|uniref:uncharacterized protein n=1 Tax=Mycotypha africana TaxID=64632 RepID=UPI0023015A4B|nr:uncharacterized protein BDF20DRAFT_883190 [Mycotypha africana]KAI8973588.1 hypothetical protein BDF20DRAFT_883190 [Mycotypha africana]
MQGMPFNLAVGVSHRHQFLDLLDMISTTETVCLVAVDFAGLTINQDDLLSFLR